MLVARGGVAVFRDRGDNALKVLSNSHPLSLLLRKIQLPLNTKGSLIIDRKIVMEIKYNKNLIQNAKNLRKNMTKEERHLWYDFLRTYYVKFNRQKVLGKYIADFYSAKAKLVIELDGFQHYEQINIEKDTERTKYLEQFGLTVLRIPNNYVNQHFRESCEYIDSIVKERIK